TNGYTPAVGFLARRVFPLFTFASLTRPLTADEQAFAGAEPEWGLVPEERMGSTVLRTRGHRLLVRNTVRYTPDIDDDDSAFRALPGPAWIPPEPLLGIGVRATLARLQRRAGREL